MKSYLLVFDDGNGAEIDLRGFVDTLDSSAEMLTLDGHVLFLKSMLPVTEVSKRFLEFAGSSLFFIADVTSCDYEGRMPGLYWDFIKKHRFEAAAE